MSKRETIEGALMSLTRSRMLDRALKGWRVLEPISLASSHEFIPCELCGTRFQRGAWVTHTRHKPRIAVGGTCLKALLLEAFPDCGIALPRKRDFTTTIRQVYAGILDPGDWKKWVIDSVPPELAREAVELDVLGMTLKARGLRRLIDFHDDTRKYPTESLIVEYDYVPKGLRGRRFMTLNQAHHEILKLNSLRFRTELAEQAITEYIKENEREWSEGDPWPWHRLETSGRNVVAAVQAIASEAELERLCSSQLVDRWPRLDPDIRNVFCWHPKRGAAHIDPESGELWLTHSGQYIRVADRHLWYSVSGASQDAVDELVRLAFAPSFRLACEPEAHI